MDTPKVTILQRMFGKANIKMALELFDLEHGSTYSCNTIIQNENITLFIMGYTTPEIRTPVPPNAGNEMKSFVGMLNFIRPGVS